jgi:glycerol-3-phosphate O-acyltransferase
MRAEDQYHICQLAFHRVSNALLLETEHKQHDMEHLLAESVFLALQRVPLRHPSFWKSIQKRLVKADVFTQRMLLAEICWYYLRDISGHFDMRIYRLASGFLPGVLGLLLRARSPKRLWEEGFDFQAWDETIILQGELESFRRLCEIGTVVLAPTHVSHLDSLVLGFSLYRLHLAPFVYGAGRSLFDNPILGFFLKHLGAYSVDDVADPIYKSLLKAYSSLVLELGYNCFMFPGGKRSPSGALEDKIKLGLLGTSLHALKQNLLAHRLRSKIFVIPITVSYQLVLEAESLIDDYLSQAYAARYVLKDDEFSRPERLLDFIHQILSLDSKIYVTFGKGLDPLGNLVNEHGDSVDPMGRPMDVRWFFTEKGCITNDHERDREYTRELGTRIVEHFRRDNVIQSTHVLAFVMWSLIRESAVDRDDLDLIRLEQLHGHGYAMTKVYERMDNVLKQLYILAKSGQIRLAPVLLQGAEEVVSMGFRHFQIYHRAPAVVRRGDNLIPAVRRLLYYYANRLAGYLV